MKTQISILGCGWLGLPLAKEYIQNGYSIKGSTTTIEKKQALEKENIKPFLIQLFENSISGNLDKLLENSKILVINIPPKLRSNATESFVAKIKNTMPYIEKATIQWVIFISSTSVYHQENNCVTEETPLQPATESGRQLVQVEQLLKSNPHFKTTIIRFGGLIGSDRHPITSLAGRLNLENPNAAINLIHQDDCIGIILKITQLIQEAQLSQNEIFNAVTPFHPSRKDYYTQKASELHLPIPQFKNRDTSAGKIINSTKLEKKLGYLFKKPTL